MGTTLQISQLAPDFTLPDLTGKLHRLSDYRDRIVILNFWSAQCPHTERADRELLTCLSKWGEKVILLSIASNANEPPVLLAEVARLRGVQTVLRDADHSIADLYCAVTTPHLIVIDADGILRYQGAFDDVTFRQRTPTKLYLKDAVDALLAGGQPEPAEVLSYGCSIVRYG